MRRKNKVKIRKSLKQKHIMKKNIGLVTWLGNGNFGTSLQAFALYKYLTDNGYECRFVSQFNYTKFKVKSLLKYILRRLGILEYMRKKKFIRKDPKKLIKLWNFLHSNIEEVFVDTPAQYNNLLKNIDESTLKSPDQDHVS